MISKLCFTILTVINFLPLFLPCIMRELTNLSTMGHWAFLNLLAANLAAEWGRYLANFSLTAMWSWRDISATLTSSQLHLLKSLISGSSALTGMWMSSWVFSISSFQSVSAILYTLVEVNQAIL